VPRTSKQSHRWRGRGDLHVGGADGGPPSDVLGARTHRGSVKRWPGAFFCLQIPRQPLESDSKEYFTAWDVNAVLLFVHELSWTFYAVAVVAPIRPCLAREERHVRKLGD